VFGVRCSVFGVRCSVFGVRCSVFGVRCSVFGARRTPNKRAGIAPVVLTESRCPRSRSTPTCFA